MPEPSVSDRERLLRLIDGGAEALREMHADEPAGDRPKRAHSWAALRRFKAQLRLVSGRDILDSAGRLLVFAAIAAGLVAGAQLVSILIRPRLEKPNLPASSGTIAPADEGTGLRLVGVDLSEPAVAMLEDVSTGKTYFARVNEKVKGVRVKKILKNMAVVSFNGRTVELT